jgi:hypothetical protein
LFPFILIFTSLDLLATATTPWVVVDLVPPPSRTRLSQETNALIGANGPLIAAEANETRPFGLSNQTVRFAQFRARASSSYSSRVRTHFGDYAEELTTSSMSSMKGENSSNNESDLDKGNILKSTFDTLTEVGCKAFEAYRANLEELFLSRCEVTWHGTVFKDTTPIVFNKHEVIPEVRPELLHRLIEERDEKKLDDTSVNPSSFTCAVSFTQTNPHTSGALAGSTSMLNPLAEQVIHFHNRTTIEGLAPTFGMPQQNTTNMFGQGYTQTAPSFSMPNFTSVPYTSEGNDW